MEPKRILERLSLLTCPQSDLFLFTWTGCILSLSHSLIQFHNSPIYHELLIYLRALCELLCQMFYIKAALMYMTLNILNDCYCKCW